MEVPAPLVRLEDVALGHGRRDVLSDVSLDVSRGDYLGIIGPNGSGKTTLLRGLLGLLAPRRGRLRYPSGRPRFGWVRQRQQVDEIFPLTVREIVLMGRHGRLGPLRRPGVADRRAVDEALDLCGLGGLGDQLFRTLSGGQSQRCLVARALVSEPDVLVLDEPTNDMDVPGEERMLRLISEIRSERRLAVVLVTHLLHVVLNVAEHLALIANGRVTVGSIEELATSEALSAFYGAPLAVETVAGRRAVVPLAVAPTEVR